jgi:tRNA splicing endonuclease
MMEQLIIHIESAETTAAIKSFIQQFDDATIADVTTEQPEAYFIEKYGLSKSAFENRLNIGIAEALLNNTSNWDAVKKELMTKIESHEDN